MDTIEHKGLTFRIEVKPDGDMGAPWDEHDGHGPVRVARVVHDHAHKEPGERVLYADRGDAWLYDWAEAMLIARRDRWGLAPDDKAALAKKLGRAPKPDEIREAAVQADFDYCRRYCTGDWHWAGVVVTLLDTDGEPTSETESVWGVESDSHDYHKELAQESAGSIAARIGRRKFIETRIRVRE